MSNPGKSTYGGRERRSLRREQIFLPASVLTLERSYCATIENLSEAGVCLRGCPNLQPGDDLWLKVGCVDRLVTVAWSDGDLSGVTFEPPLDHDDLVHLRCEARNTLVMRLDPEERAAAEDWISGQAR
jgi:hypothetical protein